MYVLESKEFINQTLKVAAASAEISKFGTCIYPKNFLTWSDSKTYLKVETSSENQINYLDLE